MICPFHPRNRLVDCTRIRLDRAHFCVAPCRVEAHCRFNSCPVNQNNPSTWERRGSPLFIPFRRRRFFFIFSWSPSRRSINHRVKPPPPPVLPPSPSSSSSPSYRFSSLSLLSYEFPCTTQEASSEFEGEGTKGGKLERSFFPFSSLTSLLLLILARNFSLPVLQPYINSLIYSLDPLISSTTQMTFWPLLQSAPFVYKWRKWGCAIHLWLHSCTPPPTPH